MAGAGRIAVVIGLLAVASGCARDQTVQSSAPVDRELNVRSALVYDTNKNGEVTKEEMEAGLSRELATADNNGDGALDLSEMQAENQRRFVTNQSGFSPLIDWNRDGKVDRAEFSTTARSLFAELDVNQNGVLAAEELRIPRAPPRPQAAPARLGRR
jgi:EF hand